MKSRLVTLVFIFIILPRTVTHAEDWVQDAHDAQRTGYTSEEPKTPWTWKWSFNGPDTNGGTGNHIYNAPFEARTISGGSNIYVPAGSRGIYALSKSNGQEIWHFTDASILATPAYHNGFVYAGGTNGTVYKINANTGTAQSLNIGNSISKAILFVDPFVFVVTDNGKLFKIDSTSLILVWSNPYVSNSTIATPASYSPSRDSIIFATDDLYVHAVKNSDGSRLWRVKPSDASITAGFPNDFEFGWPVIAEKHGIVFVRMRIEHDKMLTHGVFPSSQTATQELLTNSAGDQNLFALDLDDGTKAFIPAVGYGSTEDFINGNSYAAMGSQPVIKTWSNGDEVAYIHFRNGQRTGVDYRWDSHLGEMVLDSTTISGLPTGQLRFINSVRDEGGASYDKITDEQTPLTMAGNIIFNSHWAALSGHTINTTERNDDTKGLTLATKIKSTPLPNVMRAMRGPCENISKHTNASGMNYMTDGSRYFDGPGFFVYCNVADPPGWRFDPNQLTTGASNVYSAGFLPRYTYAADGLLVVEGNGGDISVFSHSGTIAPTVTAGPSPTPSRTPTPSPTPIPGDINGDTHVNAQDITALLLQLNFSIYQYNAIVANYGKY